MIELTNVTKTFKVYKRDANSKNVLRGLLKREHEEIKALNDISFKVGDGEIVRLYRAEWCGQIHNY